MPRLIAHRLLLFPLVLALVYVATFALMAAAPGDALVGDATKVQPEVLKQMRERYRLDKPWPVQMAYYAKAAVVGVAHGRVDLGDSIQYKGKPVAEILGMTAATWSRGALRTSLTLGMLALTLAVMVGVHLGVWAAVRQNRLTDHICMAVSVVGISLPTFVTGAVLIMLLALLLPIFPVGGWGSLGQMILPAVTLSLPFMATIARLMRAGMLDVLGSDFIRTARAKGVTERAITYRHAFKLAFLPVLSFLGPAAAAVLTGSFVVEQLFAVPGMGQHFTASVLHRDYPVILATVRVYAVLLIAFNVLVDVAYFFVDPRISQEEGR
jgi:oligopeptide transport system permease protein